MSSKPKESKPDFRVFVPGSPQPEGSTRVWMSGGKPVVSHVNQQQLEYWRKMVTLEAVRAARRAGWNLPYDGPVSVKVRFWLYKPRSPKFPIPATKPDLDKLVRAIGDGLCPKHGLGVLREDSRIVGWMAAKTYALPRPGSRIPPQPGAEIYVNQVNPEDWQDGGGLG